MRKEISVDWLDDARLSALEIIRCYELDNLSWRQEMFGFEEYQDHAVTALELIKEILTCP